MKNLHFTQEQVTKILEEIAIKENGLQELQKLSLEAMMRAEREEHNATNGDMSNGYRPRRTFGRGKIIELRVPRSRNGQFYPILLSLLRDQEEECRKLAFNLYGNYLYQWLRSVKTGSNYDRSAFCWVNGNCFF